MGIKLAGLVFGLLLLMVGSLAAQLAIRDGNNVTQQEKSWLLQFQGQLKNDSHSEKSKVTFTGSSFPKASNAKGQSIPWYKKVPVLPILFLESRTIPDGKCKSQVERYVQDLRKGTLWATKSEWL